MFGAFTPGTAVAPFNPLSTNAAGRPTAPPAAARVTTHDFQKGRAPWNAAGGPHMTPPHIVAKYLGRGELVPGSYPIPFNPFTGSALPNLFGVGELTPGSYSIPFNPISAMAPTGCGDCGGMGCLGDAGDDALANVDLSSILGTSGTSLSSSISSFLSGGSLSTVLTWGFAGFMLIYLVSRPDRKAYKQEKADAIARVKRKYPRRMSTAASRLGTITA